MANVELTGRGTESEKIKPHYNRAPVERWVRPDVRICRQKRWAEKRCPLHLATSLLQTQLLLNPQHE